MSGSRSVWLSMLAAVSLFTLGAVGGIMADRFHWRATAGHDSFHEQVRHDPIGVIEREMQLRPDQRVRIEAILEKRQADLEVAWRDARAQVMATADSMAAEIAAVLDAEQAKKFWPLVHRLHGTGASKPLH